MELSIAPILDWAWQVASIVAGTFVQEDAAILAGAYLVVERGFPAGLALAALLTGVIVGASRVIPTLAFPTFAACGGFGVPFRRFALAAVGAAVV